MARINVEQKALTDPRFRLVGDLLDIGKLETQHALGLYACILVWDQCQERGTDKLPRVLIDSIIPGLSDLLLLADLAEDMKDLRSNLRIKGAAERCLWLKNAREAGKAGGKKGGRPPIRDSAAETQGGFSTKTPPSPALTLAPTEKKQKHTVNGEAVDRWRAWFFGPFWRDYPRRKAKQDALKAWMKHRPDDPEKAKDVCSMILTALARDVAEEWVGWPPDKIPYPATWLRRESFAEADVLEEGES